MSIQLYSEKNRHELRRLVEALSRGELQGVTKDQVQSVLASFCLQPDFVGELTGEEHTNIYDSVCELLGAAERFELFKALAAFVFQHKGLPQGCWDYCLAYEHDSVLVGALAHAKLSLYPVDDKMAGIQALMNFIRKTATYHALEGIFLTCDLRVMPELESFFGKLTSEERLDMLRVMMTPCFSLPAVYFLMMIIKSSDGEEQNQALHLLKQMPQRAVSVPPQLFLYDFPASHPDYDHPQVIDAIMPMPSWNFTAIEPMVVHTWTCAEYVKRMEPELKPVISSEAWESIEQAWKR